MNDKETAAPDHPPMISISLERLKDRLYGERVLIQPYPAEEATAGGIWLPGSAVVKQNSAWVVDMGPEAKEALPDLHIGDTIVFPEYAALEIFQIPPPPQKGVEYLLLNAQDIPMSMKGSE